MLKYNELKTKPREFLASTGLKRDAFEQLLPAFRAAYEKKSPPDLTQEGTPRQRQCGGGAKGALPEIEDKLFFILVYHKTHPLQTMHGLQFGMSQPQAHFWIHRLLPILQHALRDLGEAPERDARRVAVSPLALAGGPHLQVDGTERRRQRPKDDTQQKAHSSGKKKAHTDKNILVVNANTKKVVYLSPTVPGKTHDKKATDAAQVAYPTNATLDKDTGFQGYEPAATLTTQPKKKPPGKELSVGEKFLNTLFSSVRVVVEHTLSGVKRCRIVKDVLRLTTTGIADLVMEIACGLHNLRVSCRHPLPLFDLMSFWSDA